MGVTMSVPMMSAPTAAAVMLAIVLTLTYMDAMVRGEFYI